MYHGFVKVASATPYVTPADCNANAENIIEMIKTATGNGAEVVVFPRLCVTGSTCKDLFLYDTLLNGSKDALDKIADSTKGIPAIVFVGSPVKDCGKIFDCAVAISDGNILGYVPLSCGGKSEYFAEPNDDFTNHFVFTASNNQNVKIAVCDENYATDLGATLLISLLSEAEVIGRAEKRRVRASYISQKYCCGLVMASAGDGESTTDAVFAGHNIICENGKILSESNLFENGIVYAEVDIEYLVFARRKSRSVCECDCIEELFALDEKERNIDRQFSRLPFVPADKEKLQSHAELAFNIQASALKTRIERTKTKSLVVGVSGGLDSTLALIVAVEASKKSIVKPKVIAITMPCFGTTGRTKSNSVALSNCLGAELREINIKNSVNSHFADIGHSENVYDVTYENAQARERTQVLMDVANMEGGMVIGTGDMSELALGWATYNGDHMSMYGVNASVPKTFIPHEISWYADVYGDNNLRSVVSDILDTPVSPELLPSDGKEMTQKTEDFVGPYELHDFFIYNLIHKGWDAKKTYFIAKKTFSDYSEQIILKWLKTFIRRFFTQQFKRSCTPDGASIGSVSLSTRTDFYMPSDASAKLWLEQLENL